MDARDGAGWEQVSAVSGGGKKVQAKHLDELPFLLAAWRAPVVWWNFAERELPGVPPKVVLAKWRALVKRGLVDGCDCGCYGGFTLTEEGQRVLSGE